MNFRASIWSYAGVTGAFCAVFALVAQAVLPEFSQSQAALMGGVSGFLGSLVARVVLERKQ